MSRTTQSALDGGLQREIATVAKDRVNALPSVVGERYCALRYSLDRVNENVCDGYATDATPDVPADTPVECKAVRLFHADQEGRFAVQLDSHDELLERGGVYAIAVYTPVEHAGEERILVLESALVDPAEVDRWITHGAADYQRVRWSLVLDAEIDVARWSA